MKSYLKNDEFAFENSQEMAGLFSHDHSNLDRGSIVHVININSLEGACCDLIVCGVAPLMSDREKTTALTQRGCQFSRSRK